MSFYQTNNSSIVRFLVHDPARQVIAPFQTLQRVVQIEKIGQGTGAHFTGTNLWQTSATGTVNTSWFLTPEQIQNGALIINPTGAGGGATCDKYTLPAPYTLQEYLGGRGAFNMAANLVNVGAGANPMTGLNDYFILDVYNTSLHTGFIVAYDNATTKPIQAGTGPIGGGAGGQIDARATPVLIQFEKVYSPYATINGVANQVNYKVY